MAKYRKESIVVEAEQFDPHAHPWPDGVIPWPKDGLIPRDMSWGYIQTPDGRKHVFAGDWIITHADGEKYSRHPDIFTATYEAVEASE